MTIASVTIAAPATQGRGGVFLRETDPLNPENDVFDPFQGYLEPTGRPLRDIFEISDDAGRDWKISYNNCYVFQVLALYLWKQRERIVGRFLDTSIHSSA